MARAAVRRRHVIAAAGILLAYVAIAVAAPEDDAGRQRRLEFMTGKMDEFTLATEKAEDRPLAHTKEPVLAFSNPARGNAVGALFLWLADDRPAAVACFRIRPDGSVWREFTSLSDEPLLCKRGGKTLWSPKTGIDWKPLPGAPKPAATAAARLVQMRRLAERFSADFDHLSAKRWEELRLLPQPIYRYTAKKDAEGAIFALAQSNDPEAILLLELARPAKGEPVWSYALARTSSQRMRGRLDDREVWTVAGYWSNPRSPDDPYQEAPDGKFADGAAEPAR